VLEGEYAGSLVPPDPIPAEPLVVFAGRMIPEKRAPLGVEGVALAARRIPGLRGTFFGDGPERDAVLAAIARSAISGALDAPGFVDSELVDASLRRGLCMLLPSRREGYGMVVVEAASRGTPSIVVAAEDNAATELVEEGVNGYVVADADAEAIAEAIIRVNEAGMTLRESTASWFAEHAERLSLEHSLTIVLQSYGR
jgi:glycosyltransferase involved in cell wall biosynthesis